MSRIAHFVFAVSFFILVATSASAQDMPADYQEVLKLLARSGDYKGGALKVNIPRMDLQVTIAGRPTPTPFGFGGWVGMTKAHDGQEVLMGDLVLTQEEVNPTLSALLDNGIEVTALHNHFFWDEPRLFFMHVHAHGKAADLARKLKPALEKIGRAPAAASPAAAGSLDTAALARIAGYPGEQLGPVYKITVGRDDLGVKEMGAAINARMGLNSWAAFAGSDSDAQIAGDIAMRESEVQPVLKALRAHNLDIVAIHQHMLGTQPTVIFLHYWGHGPAAKLDGGFRAALDQLGHAKAR
jgi:hypothetical protein